MAMTDSEIESIRVHLGYGAIKVAAYPYTADGFFEVFHQVVQPNLDERQSTSVALAIAAGAMSVTPASMTGIVPFTKLFVDVADAHELVVVRSVTLTTFSADFAKAHGAGCPVQVESGVARLRALLWSADKAWGTLQSAGITQTAGIKQLGQGEIEWFPGGQVLAQTLDHYKSIVSMISAIVRVDPAWSSSGRGGRSNLEAY